MHIHPHARTHTDRKEQKRHKLNRHKLHRNWSKSHDGGEKKTYIQIKSFSTFNKGTFLIGYWTYIQECKTFLFLHWFNWSCAIAHIQFSHNRMAYRFGIFDRIIAKSSHHLRTYENFIICLVDDDWLLVILFCCHGHFAHFSKISLKITGNVERRKKNLLRTSTNWRMIQVHHRFINGNVFYSINFWSALIQFKSNFAMISDENLFLLSLFRSFCASVYWCAGLIGHRSLKL